jgi:outer membrane biosynthesis protein TonB
MSAGLTSRRSRASRGRAPVQRATAAAAGTRTTAGASPGLLHGGRTGPAVSLTPGIQRQVAIGKADDQFEKEAESVAERVTEGKQVEPGDISAVEPGAIPQTMPETTKQGSEERQSEPVQKAEAPAAEEKKPEPIQKTEAPATEEKKPEPIQKTETPATEEKKPEPIQKTETPAAEEKQPEPVQKDEAAGAGNGESAAADQAIRGKDPGNPLEPGVRDRLESGLGVDLSEVRVHEDAAARRSAADLNARAFTHGNDIWLGPGASQDDAHLMAHEATHVVQQAGGVRRMVQKAKDPTNEVLKSPGGTIDVKNKQMLLPKLEIPEFKFQYLKSESMVTIKKGGAARPGGSEDQRAIWKDKVASKAEPKAKELLTALPGIRTAKPGQQDTDVADEPGKTDSKLIFLPMKGGQIRRRRKTRRQKDGYLIGTPEELKSEFVIPRWDMNGQPRAMDVDHKEELQLGGANTIENMMLLDASSNRSSGSRIAAKIRQTIKNAVVPHAGKAPFKSLKKRPKSAELSALKSQYTITYEKIAPSTRMNPPDKDARWEKPDVEGAKKPLEALGPPLNASQVVEKKLLGEPTRLVIYPLTSGGVPKEISWDAEKKSPDGQVSWSKLGFKGLDNPSITYDESSRNGAINGMWPSSKKKRKKQVVPKPITLPLVGVGEFPYTCRMEKGGLLQSMRYAELYALSRAEFQQVDFDPNRGIVARGKLAPSQPFFKRLDIDIVIDDEGVSLEKTFSKSDFNFPGPVQVTDASLTVMLGTGGLEVGGEINLDIPRLGTGTIGGRIGRSGDLELTGAIDFDSKLFDPARASVTYAGGKFSGEGEIGVPPGKVKGVKSAKIKASFDEDKITAEGSVQPDIPAVESGAMSMTYSKEKGLEIAGSLQLKKDIPGIAGGSIKARVIKRPDQDRYLVKATGKAQPKIPGISSELTVTYDDGAFDAVVTAGFEKGRLKGSLTAGATNRPLADGKPQGKPAEGGGAITLYGGGSLTLKLTPWLEGTAGVKLNPKGEIEVVGEIGLPGTVEIFPEKKLEKNLFQIGIDIPIVGVAVAGQRIGIFANISGGLDLSAGIGPGQLKGKLRVDYNPAHEDQTRVQGDVNLHVPAHAGIRLFVRGGLGVGIPIVSAQAGIEVGGQLGLEGALDTGVHVDWTPTKGLVLDANAKVSVEPKFRFDVTGFVLVEADLLLTTIELYNKRWKLAGFEYGSGMRFGVEFPVHYEQGKPIDLSLDNVKFQTPDIKPKQLLSDLVKRIA